MRYRRLGRSGLHVSSLEQFNSLLPALDISLTEADLQFCDSLVLPGAYVVNYFNTSRWMK